MNTFYDELYKMKTLTRKGWEYFNKDKEVRIESDAEHTFSMALLALEIIHKENLQLDELKVLKMVLYHDMCEIDTGDHTPLEEGYSNKYENEEKAMARLSSSYNMPEMLNIWKEFEARQTPEAKFVKVLDRLDSVLQSKVYSQQWNKKEIFDEFYNNHKETIKDFIKYVDH